MTIDGLTQPGSVDGVTPDLQTLTVVLDGTSAGGVADALTIKGGGCTIRGLIIVNFVGGGFSAFLLDTAGGNTIEKCWMGLEDDGDTDAGNDLAGVYINPTSPNNTINGCLISGNGGCGFNIQSDGNTIQNCYVGTDKTGTLDRGNDVSGSIFMGTPSNTTFADCVFSGNVAYGIDRALK